MAALGVLEERDGKPVDVFPQPFSPLRWYLASDLGDGYRIAARNLAARLGGVAISATRRQGIRSLGFLMVGNPGETRATVAASRLPFSTDLSADQIVTLGQALGVEAVFFGTAGQQYGSSQQRPNTDAQRGDH